MYNQPWSLKQRLLDVFGSSSLETIVVESDAETKVVALDDEDTQIVDSPTDRVEDDDDDDDVKLGRYFNISDPCFNFG